MFLVHGFACCVTPQSPEQLCDEEPIYKLAWNLDAAITQRKLTVKHMRQLAEALKQHLEVCGLAGCCQTVGSVTSILMSVRGADGLWFKQKGQ